MYYCSITEYGSPATLQNVIVQDRFRTTQLPQRNCVLFFILQRSCNSLECSSPEIDSEHRSWRSEAATLQNTVTHRSISEHNSSRSEAATLQNTVTYRSIPSNAVAILQQSCYPTEYSNPQIDSRATQLPSRSEAATSQADKLL